MYPAVASELFVVKENTELDENGFVSCAARELRLNTTAPDVGFATTLNPSPLHDFTDPVPAAGTSPLIVDRVISQFVVVNVFILPVKFQSPVAEPALYIYIEALLRLPIALKLYRFVAFESVHRILVLLFTLFSTSVIPALFA
jgi:hypothetical protein